jgi:hypothetical protein
MSEPYVIHGWGVGEFMGHTRLGGYFTTVEVCGVAALRVMVPETDRGAAFERVYSRDALFSFTPTSEDLARAVAQDERHFPVQLYGSAVYQQLTEGRGIDEDAQDEDDARYEVCDDEDVQDPHNAGPF